MSEHLERWFTCDGPKCRERRSDRSVGRWTKTDDGRDLCGWCSQGKCAGTVGKRPSWMSPDQYDPCSCALPLGHHGECLCKHDLDFAAAVRDTEGK